VHGEIRPGRSAADEGGTSDTHTFFVRLNELECVKESAWDRASRQDEIFLVALGVPIGGEVQSARTPVFNNVNDGSRKRITNIGFNLTVNRAHGVIALPVAAWESDSESGAARDRIQREFETGAKEGGKDDSRGFLEEIARAVAAVGNYGELLERNVGPRSSLGLERGLNRLSVQGGLIQSPPFR